MAKTQPPIDKLALLGTLETLEPENAAGTEEEQFRDMSLGRALRVLAQFDHERERALCRTVAEHVMDHVADPVDMEDDA